MKTAHFAALLALSTSFAAHATDSPEEILKKADEIRNPAQSYFLKVQIDSSLDASTSQVLDVYLKGNDKTLVKTLEPKRDRGRNLLMLDENMWAFIPNLKRSVRVALSQKLTGQAANGDITRTRWSGDYSPTLEKEDAKQWTLFLAAKKKGLTYEKLRVMIEKSTFRPLKAEFLTLAGKPLKNASYESYQEMFGRQRPTVIQIQDAVRPDDKSVIKILEMKVKDLPDSMFKQSNLE